VQHKQAAGLLPYRLASVIFTGGLEKHLKRYLWQRNIQPSIEARRPIVRLRVVQFTDDTWIHYKYHTQLCWE